MGRISTGLMPICPAVVGITAATLTLAAVSAGIVVWPRHNGRVASAERIASDCSIMRKLPRYY